MHRKLTLGHCRGLSDTLRTLGYQAVSSLHADEFDLNEVIQGDLESDNLQLLILEDWVEIQQYLLDALIGLVPVDPEYVCHVEKLRKSINDDILLELLEKGRVVNLMVDERDYFLIEEVYGYAAQF